MFTSIQQLFDPPEPFSDFYTTKRAIRCGEKLFPTGEKISADYHVGLEYSLDSAYKDNAKVRGDEEDGVFVFRSIHSN